MTLYTAIGIKVSYLHEIVNLARQGLSIIFVGFHELKEDDLLDTHVLHLLQIECIFTNC